MKKNQNLLGLAFIIVAIQLFLLLLPTTRYTNNSRYHSGSESYSATQMVINYNDTINDANASSDPVTFSFIFGALTVYLMLTALVNFVQALTFDHTSHKKMSLLCWASCFLALIPLVSWFFLIIIYEEGVYITFLGFVQMASSIAFTALFNYLVPDTQDSSPEYTKKIENFFKSTETKPVSTTKYCPYCGQGVTSNWCDICGKDIHPATEKIPTWKKIQQQENN